MYVCARCNQVGLFVSKFFLKEKKKFPVFYLFVLFIINIDIFVFLSHRLIFF